MPTHAAISLWWPEGSRPSQPGMVLSPHSVDDLELDTLLTTVIDKRVGSASVREMLLTLCTDPAIISYRQAMLDDLWRHPTFPTHLEALLPDLQALVPSPFAAERHRSLLAEVTWRLGDLEHLVACVQGLTALFAELGDTVQAAGWRALRDRITQTAQDPVYQHLTQALPALVQTIRAKVSVTIGVNLDAQLRPVAATLLAVHEQKFTASTFLDRLFGSEGPMKGLGPLHSVPDLAQRQGPGRRQDVNPLMVPLFHDLATVLETVCRPVAQALRRYTTLHSDFLVPLHDDLALALAVVRLRQRLHAHGLPMCRPTIVPMAERVCELHAAYNLTLALHQLARTPDALHLVPNEVQMDAQGRIAILTGPNQGGKTTYTQMVGVCQVLAQAGLWVPATSARLSPVDNIYTHYPVAEQVGRGTGRFGDEAQRLRHIFTQSTRHSLILLNESLASTHASESLYIAQDLVRMLRRLGVRALFATHLHELAAAVDTLNAEPPGESRIVSLVASHHEAGAEGLQRAYKIVPGPPAGRSYAQEIAAHYGISYDQLTTLLKQRGVLP